VQAAGLSTAFGIALVKRNDIIQELSFVSKFELASRHTVKYFE
jgi:hypothetical protein